MPCSIPAVSIGDIVKMANGRDGKVLSIVPSGISPDRVMVKGIYGALFTVPATSVTVLAHFYNC